jgi:DNA-binding GntR family transcriptional regulator
MVMPVRKRPSAKRAALLCALLALLVGGVYVAKVGVSGWASADPDSPAPNPAAHRIVSKVCSTAVLGALGDIAMRVYHEGVVSERTAAAIAFIERSAALREAIERDDSHAARTAAQALIATGHMTNLQVLRDGKAFVDVGSPNALAPLHGSIPGASGVPIASFVASVWADSGFVTETDGIAEGDTALRQDGHSIPIPGSLVLAPRALPTHGTLSVKGVAYDYISFAGTAYPNGRPLRVYLFKSIASIAPLCGATSTDTLINTLSHVAQLIYTSEGGPRALVQVQRAQHNQALLRAVAAREPEATRLAIDALLTEHIVRIRVSTGGQLLSDVGGPWVLAPVRAPLRLNGRLIGSMVLSVQDDEGYKRLAERLAGLDVLMYMQPPGSSAGSTHPELVKNSLGPDPGPVPASGVYHYRGRTFRVFTLHAEAFPSGPLRIVVLIPIPYS